MQDVFLNTKSRKDVDVSAKNYISETQIGRPVTYDVFVTEGMYPETTPILTTKEGKQISKQSKDWFVNMADSKLRRRKTNDHFDLKLVFTRPLKSQDGPQYDLKLDQSAKLMTVVKLYNECQYSQQAPHTNPYNFENSAPMISIVTTGLLFAILY